MSREAHSRRVACAPAWEAGRRVNRGQPSRRSIRMSKNSAAVRERTGRRWVVDQQAFLPPVIAAEGLYAACWLEKEAKNSSMLGGVAAGEKIPPVKGAAGAMRAASGA